MLRTSTGLALQDVLVVDDQRQEVEELMTFLSGQGCHVHFYEKSEDARDFISSSPKLDLAILDYWIESDNSAIARLLLDELRNYHFVPVVIYSKHREEAEEQAYYPREMYIVIEKAADVHALEKRVLQWFESSLHAQLAVLWSQTIRNSLVQSMWTLFSVSDNGLGLILKAIKAGNPTVQGHYELLDSLQRILFNYVTTSSNFMAGLQAIVGRVKVDLDFNDAAILESYGRIKQIEMYIKPPDTSVLNTGDLFEKEGKYYVLTTPSCDIYNDKTDSIDFIEAFEYGDFLKTSRSFKREMIPQLLANSARQFNLHFLPFVSENLHLVCKFHSVVSHDKETFANEKAKWKKIATLSSPYREHFIQRYSAAVSRLGVIDLAKEFRSSLQKMGEAIIETREAGSKEQ
jgi:CheY-like chemotaxis protein